MVKVNIRDLSSIDLKRLIYDDPEKKEGYYHSEISYLDQVPEPKVKEDKENKLKSVGRSEELKRGDKVDVVLEEEPEEVDEEPEEEPEPETSQFLVKIKSPKSRHSDIIKHDDRYYLDIYLSESDPLALFVCDVDDNNVKAIHEHSISWFSNSKKSSRKIPVDIVEEMYRSPMSLKQKRTEDGERMAYNRMRLVIPTHGESVQCEVYNQKGQLVSLEDIKSGRDISLAISLDSLWLNKKTAGCHWTVRQMKVKEEIVRLKKSRKLEGYALPSDDEAED